MRRTQWQARSHPISAELRHAPGKEQVSFLPQGIHDTVEPSSNRYVGSNSFLPSFWIMRTRSTLPSGSFTSWLGSTCRGAAAHAVST